jgi:hypothetical protein
MLERGIDAVALEAYRRRLRILTEDHYHGRVLRRLCRMGMSMGVIDGIIEQAKTNEDLYAILYHTISGHSYRRISRDLLSMATIWKMSALTLKRVLRPSW